MRLISFLFICTLGACQSGPTAHTAAPVAAPFYTLHDLTDDYVRFYDRTEGMTTNARVAAFKAEMDPLFPGFYDVARIEGTTPEEYDALIARSFQDFPHIRERYLEKATSFASMIEPARAAFVAMFPDAPPIGDIYLVHSLGEMDGGTREIGGETYAIFGADAMAMFHQSSNEQPFFHHELFHFYHRAFFNRCEAIWCSLWSEGLAVYVTSQMNPGADDAALALTVPRPIRPDVDANLAFAVCEVRNRLESEAIEDYRPLFFGNAHLGPLPPRAGYYIGYLIAREAGRTRSAQDLAKLDVAQVRPIVDAALSALAECPASAAN